MARAVILIFEDNEPAERFVDHMDNRMGATALNAASIVLAYGELHKVVAIPTKFCQCKNPKGFGRSKGFGWWIHKACKKPVEKPWGPKEEGFWQLIWKARDLLSDIRNRERKES